MNGFKHVRLEALDSNVQWVFAENDGMKALVAKFEAGKVKVEPRAFQLQVKKVRDEMYQFSRRSRRSA